MAQRGDRSKTPRLVPAEYGLRLKAAAEQLGLGFEQLAELAHISPVTAWRVTKGEGTVKAAEAMRGALLDHAFKTGGTVEIPPPVVQAPLELHEWLRIGEALFVIDRDQFDKVLARTKKLVEALQGVEDDISAISHPLPRKKT
jgi:transcriptional regulator with XRE-family HTH domain